MAKYTIAVLVRNEFGVLNRVTSMIRRRHFNINSLTVGETESDKYSRITVTYDGEADFHHQIMSQLYKLPDVCKVKELASEESINCELVLIKVKNGADVQDRIKKAAEAFRAETVDETDESVIMRISGGSKRIDSFVTLMQDFEILEMCRTGVVALERGSGTILDDM